MRLAFVAAALLSGCLFVACGSSGSGSGGSGGGPGAGGDNSGVGAHSGAGKAGKGTIDNNGGDGTSETAGGAGGDGTVLGGVTSNATPHEAVGLVPGGVIAHSENFTAVLTLGESRLSTSESYQLRGGVIGATQP